MICCHFCDIDVGCEGKWALWDVAEADSEELSRDDVVNFGGEGAFVYSELPLISGQAKASRSQFSGGDDSEVSELVDDEVCSTL